MCEVVSSFPMREPPQSGSGLLNAADAIRPIRRQWGRCCRSGVIMQCTGRVCAPDFSSVAFEILYSSLRWDASTVKSTGLAMKATDPTGGLAVFQYLIQSCRTKLLCQNPSSYNLMRC